MNSPDCTWLDDYLAGELPVDWKPLFEQHLATCHGCRQEADGWRAMREMLVRATEELEQPAENMTQRIRESLTVIPPHRAEQARARLLPAAVAVCLLTGLFLFAVPQRQDRPTTLVREPIAVREESAPVARVELPVDVIGMPVDVGDPDMTVVWLYPTYQPGDEEKP